MAHNMSHRRLYPAQYAAGVANQEYSQTQEALETQNEELVESLRGKVKELKSVTIAMGDEVRNHNHLLSNMGGDFDTTGGLLSSSVRRVKGLASAGHNNWMCYMVILIFFVFVILLYVIKWRK